MTIVQGQCPNCGEFGPIDEISTVKEKCCKCIEPGELELDDEYDILKIEREAKQQNDI